MKTYPNAIRGTALSGTAALLLLSSPAKAADAAMGNMEMPTAGIPMSDRPMSSMPGMSMPAAAPAVQPKNGTEALASLHKLYAQFVGLIKNNRQAEVHMESDQVIAAAKDLVNFAKELPSDKRGRLTGSVDNLVKAMGALHDAAHTGNSAAVEKSQASFDGVLKVIDALFSPPAPAGK